MCLTDVIFGWFQLPNCSPSTTHHAPVAQVKNSTHGAKTGGRGGEATERLLTGMRPEAKLSSPFSRPDTPSFSGLH